MQVWQMIIRKDRSLSARQFLVLNMANSIEQFTDDLFEADQDEEAGGFNFRFTDHISPESRLLMNSLVFGLQNIEEEYGEPYIKIRFEEV